MQAMEALRVFLTFLLSEFYVELLFIGLLYALRVSRSNRARIPSTCGASGGVTCELTCGCTRESLHVGV